MDVAEPKAGPDGRYAEGIFEIPLGAWRNILKRTVSDVSRNNLSLVAGGATFFLLLAIVPALTAFVALYGLVSDPSTVQQQVSALSGVLPGEAIDIVSQQLTRLASQNEGTLGIGFVAGLAVALWSANAGVKALFAAMNVVYGEEEKRSFIKLTLVSFAFTLAGIVAAALMLTSIVVVPAVLSVAGSGTTAETLISLARWPILFVVLLVGLTALFRYGASRQPPRLRWVVWGSVITAVLWVIVSAAFSFYLANFANYNATYGSLGAVIGFMMWLYVSLMILLIGAELNAEIEHQLITDTTTGPVKPMGKRRAFVADTLPENAEVARAQ